jgi:glutamate--cysteine ligase
VRVGDEYRQLSTALLQIENEFYGTIRPKRPVAAGERPLVALRRRGVEYVEVRCLDLNPFLPAGIDAETIRFLDIFLLHCLWSESPPDSQAESDEMRANQRRVVEEGRKPGLTLSHRGQAVSLAAWARALIDECRPIADRLDDCHLGRTYRAAIDTALARIDNPASTPSARVLADMRAERQPFFRFALARSMAHRRHYLDASLAPGVLAAYEAQSRLSLDEQRALERENRQSFDEFLRAYLALPSETA